MNSKVKNNKTTNLIKLGVLVLVLCMIIGAQVVLSNGFRKRGEAGSGSVETFTSLWFCSSPASSKCQDGISKLEYRIRTRQKIFRDELGVSNDESVNIKVQTVTLRFRQRTQDLYQDDFMLYEDTDGNGIFDRQADRKLARSLLKKKLLVFEDLNYQLVYSEIPDNGLDVTVNFFIFNEETGQYFDRENLKAIEVEALNLNYQNEAVQNTSSFADRSEFEYSDAMAISQEEFLEGNDMFESCGPKCVKIPSGSHEITSVVVVPQGMVLKIDPGAEIRMAPGASLVSYSPMQILGTADNHVTVTGSSDESWGTFAVIGTMENFGNTIIKYADFSGGFEAVVNGAYLSGMVSLYRNDKTTITNSTFRDARADDSLNVKYSVVDIHDNVFEDNSADAFDGDFVEGDVWDNYFDNNGNDSVDFSGSDLELWGNDIRNSGDKCMSIGERTTASIRYNTATACSIGFQIKDGSNVDIYRNIIQNSQDFGIDAYVKKPFFGEPTTSYSENIFIKNSQNTHGLIDPSKMAENYVGTSLGEFTNLPWTPK